MRLIISEKDNAAKRIAGFLAQGSVKEESKGRQKWYLFTTDDGVETTAVGLRGHILGVDFAEGHSNWEWDGLVPLIDAPLTKVPAESGTITTVKKLAKDADEYVIATDFDREGELIGVEALQVVAGALSKGKARYDFTKEEILDAVGKRPISRARYSALTKSDITKAFANTVEIDWNLAAAAETRQDIDLIWGAALTRFVSLVSGRRGRRFLSIGRVQSPTLSIIVDREEERRAFDPVPYWQVKLTVAKGSEQFIAEHTTGRFSEVTGAEKAHESASDEATVTGIKLTSKKVQPPPPFHTTTFLTAAASLGFSPSAAMNVAEHLYTSGFISYPRTDNTVYPDTIDLGEIVDAVGVGAYAPLREYVLSLPEIKPTRGKKQTTDHPPIYPTTAATAALLGDREYKIYDLVVRRFFATISPAAVQESMKVTLETGGEEYAGRGIRLVEEGFMLAYPFSRSKSEELPALNEGDKLKILDKVLEDKETQPPGRYGPGRLIELMETLGLGTKATRHEIIKTLTDRFYGYGTPLQPTLLGETVVTAIRPNGGKIFSPEMTSELEEQMDNIANGKATRDEVINLSRKLLSQVMEALIEQKDTIAPLFWSELETLGTCPKCGNNVKVKKARKSGKRFAGCSNWPDCDWSAPLPQFGEIIPQKKGEQEYQACETCESPMIMVFAKGKRPWLTCINMECPSKKEKAKAKEEAKAEEAKEATA